MKIQFSSQFLLLLLNCLFIESAKYEIQKWNNASRLTLTCSDQCNGACPGVVWTLFDQRISDSINWTLNKYGEHRCIRRDDQAKVLKKVLVVPPGNNFICPKCLTFTACRSGQRIYFHLTLNIDEDAVEKERCDMIKNGWLPQCKFDVERCSVNLTSFNSSDYLMAQCPLKNSSSAYHIDSLAQQIGPAEALESCTTATSTPDAVSTTQTTSTATIITPAQTPPPADNNDDDSFHAGGIVGIILGVLLVILLTLLLSITILSYCCNCKQRIIISRVRSKSNATNQVSNEAFLVTDDSISSTDQLRLCDDSELKELIKREHHVIKPYINFATIIQYFHKHDVFSDDDIYHFTNDPPADGVNYLIDHIQGKGEGDARKFVLALHDATEHTGHKEILKALKVTVRGDQVYHYSS